MTATITTKMMMTIMMMKNDVEIKDNQGTFSVCEREGKPYGDVSLTRGKGKDGSFLVCPQMTFLDPAEEARERGA